MPPKRKGNVASLHKFYGKRLDKLESRVGTLIGTARSLANTAENMSVMLYELMERVHETETESTDTDAQKGEGGTTEA